MVLHDLELTFALEQRPSLFTMEGGGTAHVDVEVQLDFQMHAPPSDILPASADFVPKQHVRHGVHVEWRPLPAPTASRRGHRSSRAAEAAAAAQAVRARTRNCRCRSIVARV